MRIARVRLEGAAVGEGEMTPDRARARAARALNIDRVTAEVAVAMVAAGIAYVVLKGPSIARWLYPTNGRTYCDTDLLVPPAEFERAGAVLRSLGFAPQNDGFHPFEKGERPNESVYIRRSG